MADQPVPSLYEWLGGMEPLNRLLTRFYERVKGDPLLAPVFEDMSAEHPAHVAAFVAEVLGGPPTYSGERGGHPAMIRKHLGRALTEVQRRHWIELLLDCADEVNVPTDPEFRSALLAYLEWGSRLAVLNSQPGAQAVEAAPMPRWHWGVPGGPYRG